MCNLKNGDLCTIDNENNFFMVNCNENSITY